MRALLASCTLPRALPSQNVLRLAAWNLRLNLPDIIKNRDTKRLTEAGLVREYATALLRAFPDKTAADRLATAVDLLMAGVAPRLVKPALDAWGTEAGKRVSRDPYGALWELKATTDDADALDVSQGVEARILGHVRWHSLSSKRDGHTMLPLDELARRIKCATPDRVRHVIAKAVATGALVAVGRQNIADPETVAVELAVAKEIKRRAATKYLSDSVDASAACDLTPEQLAAVDVLTSAAISVLTGGPGTGKSTVVRHLVSVLGEDKCMLTAPTGRAARNLGGNTVHSASGGRLLKRRPLQETTRADVPDDLAFMFVDEASMLSTELIQGVLNLAPTSCHVVLVGDADQLPDPWSCSSRVAHRASVTRGQPSAGGRCRGSATGSNAAPSS